LLTISIGVGNVQFVTNEKMLGASSLFSGDVVDVISEGINDEVVE